MISNEGVLDKNWGYELIWASNENYCGKIIVFRRAGNKTSMLFHTKKNKTWFINSGSFKIKWIKTDTAEVLEKTLTEGETWSIDPLTPHQLECLIDNSSLTEVSTPDLLDDYHRIIPSN